MATEHGFVTVDELCQTGVPTISAVGDLTPGPQLAHLGFAQGILAAEMIAGLPVTAIDYDGVPRITYSDPEVASVGLTTAAAAARGIETVEVRYPLGANGRSVILQTLGEAKVIAAASADGDDQPGPVLGIHLVGARVGELIAEAQLIYNWKAVPAEVAQLIHPHPTQSEMIGETHLALAGKPLHFHGKTTASQVQRAPGQSPRDRSRKSRFSSRTNAGFPAARMLILFAARCATPGVCTD